MRRVAFFVCMVALAALTGCVSQAKYDALLKQNEIQSARIKGLERDLDQTKVEMDALRTQVRAVAEARDSSGRLLGAKDSQIAVLKARCGDLEARIKDLVDRLASEGPGPGPLPKAVADALKELAAQEPTLEFDPETGTCKFSSDILFDTGDDTVKAESRRVLKRFAGIFTGVGKDLYLRIEGHTDDRRIAKQATMEKHPTNWHLSVHRAISVLRVLNEEGVGETRMCAAGYGKWRPLVENTGEANRARNRRVEIYVLRAPPGGGTDKVATTEGTVMGGE